MGESQRKKQEIKNDLINALNSCDRKVLEYPLDKYSGVLLKNMSLICDTYFEWLTTNPDKSIRLKIKQIEKWICSFDRLTKQGNVFNMKTSLITLNLPSSFRQRALKLIETEKGFAENGNIPYIALVAYCCEVMTEIKQCNEVTVSQAVYDPITNTFDAGYPILVDGQPLIQKDIFGKPLSKSKWDIFKEYFQEENFNFRAA